MKYIIIYKKQVLNIYINNCNTCGEINKAHQGKYSCMCIDCLNKKIEENAYMRNSIDKYLLGVKSKTIVRLIKTRKVERIHPGGKKDHSTWENIPKK